MITTDDPQFLLNLNLIKSVLLILCPTKFGCINAYLQILKKCIQPKGRFFNCLLTVSLFL